MKRFVVLLIGLALIAGACGTNQSDSDQTYTLTVNYDLSIEEAVAAGDYEWSRAASPTSQNFPSTRSGTDTVEAQLVQFEQTMTMEQVLKELDKQDLRPATVEELLAFGATYLDFPGYFWIIALGSVLENSSGERIAPVLWGHRSLYYANLHWPDNGWGSHYQFLAVRK